MNSDWNHLRFFLALAQNKTLTKAGIALQVSHATVYRNVKAMEEVLGVTLFESTSNGYLLSSAGKQLLEETEDVADLIETSFRKLNGLDQRIQGNIVLATTESLASKILPEIFKKFLEKHQ